MTYANVDVLLLDDEPFYATRADVPLFFFGDPAPFGTASSPPVVTIVSPALNTRIARTAPLVLDVVDPDGLDLQRLMIRSGGASAKWEQAYKDGAACVGFSVTRTAITDGYRYEITRDGGWNPGDLELEPVFGDPTASESINT